MIQVGRSNIALGRKDEGYAVGLFCLHRGQGVSVGAPGVWIARAQVVKRIARTVWRLLPAAARLWRPAPHAPLRKLEQGRQRARQLCKIALMCGRSADGNVGAFVHWALHSVRWRALPTPATAPSLTS
jgi:hypothetical protein